MTVRVTLKLVNCCVIFQGKMYNLNIWPHVAYHLWSQTLQIPGSEQRQKVLWAEKIKIHEVLMRPEAKYRVGF